MSPRLTRRGLVAGGLATAAGVAGAGSAIAYAGRIAPDATGFLGIGESLTYSAQRLLTSGNALAREFPREMISAVHPVNGVAPDGEMYRTLAADGFKDWRLTIEGLVTRPLSLSLDDLKSMPAESGTILHACEEGWSYIAEWTGVRLSAVLDMVGTRDEARYVIFIPYENVNQNTGARRVLFDSIDMPDALHPQTLLAYGMNGEALPAGHGAPLRLRLARQLGYKNTKFLHRMIVTDGTLSGPDGKRIGARSNEKGNAWYGGI